MKRLSITKKITIWYTIFLVLLATGFVVAISVMGNLKAGELTKSKLTDSVRDIGRYIERDGGKFFLDKKLKFYDEGVYLSVYDEKEELIEGMRPIKLSSLPKLKEEKIIKMRDSEGQVWYVYDKVIKNLHDNKGNVVAKKIWIRGVVKNFAEESNFSFMIRLMAVTFPILVLVVTFGGFVIIRRGFLPVRKTIATAEEIRKSGDLSKRIDVGTAKYKGIDIDVGTGDELHQLALGFNRMFDRLEKTFAQEKQFTSDVSHEFRTPLAVIISQSDYALENADYRLKALEVINKEARRMSTLLNRLLTLTKSDTGKLELDVMEIDLSDLCDNILKEQTALAREKGFELEFDILSNVKILGDEEMVIRMILNLLENAFKYGKSGEGKGSVKVRLSAEKNFACFSVEDHGPGIESKHLKDIWERFYRVDPSRNLPGEGLGLAIVKALATAHGGHVTVESEVGKGSCFKIYLPVLGREIL